MQNNTLLIKNIGMLATPKGTAAKKGAAQGEITILENAYILIQDGQIVEIGTGTPTVDANINTLDAQGKLATPGLVDCHTHLVFGGWREHELALKLKGVGYLDILRQGGGILSTVRATRAATEEELTAKAQKALAEMLSLGTTTCETKSGYGLNLEDELKQLRVAKALNDTQPIDLVSTFMGAHAIPEEYKQRPEEYVDLLINEIIPVVAKEKLAEFCDIFCETAVFNPEQSRRILLAAQQHGLPSKIHADEIDPIGGSQLAGEVKAVSAEHLIAAPDEGIDSMAAAGTIAVLLPATSFYLDKPYARAREMIGKGVAVAVASDFNPGSSPNLSMQLPMNIACYRYKMTPEEVLTAVTLNAAAAIHRADTVGSLEAGKLGDVVLWDASNLNYIFYRYGSNLVDTVIKSGRVVSRKQ